MLIYKITNKINGKIYIGKTTLSLAERWSGHKYDSKGSHLPLYKAMRKYGTENFVIEEIAKPLDPSIEELNTLERNLIEFYKSTDKNIGYNIDLGGNGPGRLSEQTKKKLSDLNKGKKHSEETKRKISEGNKGKVLSEETKKKISNSEKGKKRSPHTEEFKQKVSQKQKGKFVSKETREKLAKAQLGRKASNEAKRKMSEAKKGKKRNLKANLESL